MTPHQHKSMNATKAMCDKLARGLAQARYNLAKSPHDERFQTSVHVAETKYNEFNPEHYYNLVVGGHIDTPHYKPRYTDNKKNRVPKR